MDQEDDIQEFIDREYAGGVDFPNLNFFISRYAKPLGDNDAKAAQVFKFYEGIERVRGLQRELFVIKSGGAANFSMQKLLGIKRKGSLGSYEAWAQRLLVILSSSNTNL